MAGPLYPLLQVALLVVWYFTSALQSWTPVRIAALLLVFAIPILRAYLPLRRIDQAILLADIERVQPSSTLKKRACVLWLRGGSVWMLRYSRYLGCFVAPTTVWAFRRLSKGLRTVVGERRVKTGLRDPALPSE